MENKENNNYGNILGGVLGIITHFIEADKKQIETHKNKLKESKARIAEIHQRQRDMFQKSREDSNRTIMTILSHVVDKQSPRFNLDNISTDHNPLED